MPHRPPASGYGGPDGPSGPDPYDRFRAAQLMLGALQSTHQHADSKAGILAAVQAALVTTAAAWSGRSVAGWQRGGVSGALAGALLVLFAAGLVSAAASLALSLRPRVWEPDGANPYSFRQLSAGPDILPRAATAGQPDPLTGEAAGREAAGQEGAGQEGADQQASDQESARRELSQAVRFLAGVAVAKYRWLNVSVAGTALMGVSAGLSLLLRPWLAR